jgi:WD40 repeat protein
MASLDESGDTLAVGQNWLHETPDVVFVWDLDGPPDAEPVALRNGDVSVLNVLHLHRSGRWLATGNNQLGLVWLLGGSRPRILRGQAPRGIDVAFTPDGRWLASSSAGEGVVRLWPLSPAVAPERRIVIEEPEGHFDYLAIDPLGRHLLAVDIRGDAVLSPLDGGAARKLPRSSSAWLEAPTFSRDGQLAAAGTRMRPEGNIVEIWDLESNEVRTVDARSEAEECGNGPEIDGAVMTLEFTSDGRLLTAGMSGLRLWDLEEGTNILLRPCAEAADGPAWPILGGSREDRYLLVETDYNRKTSVLSYHDLRAGTSRELASHGTAVRSVALDPSGEIAVTGSYDGLVRVGPVAGEEPHLLYGHSLAVTSVAVSPDGLWVASGSDDGTIRLWPMPEGSPFHTLPHAEVLARLRSFTNLRVVSGDRDEVGYRVEPGPLPAWGVTPDW